MELNELASKLMAELDSCVEEHRRCGRMALALQLSERIESLRSTFGTREAVPMSILAKLIPMDN